VEDERREERRKDEKEEKGSEGKKAGTLGLVGLQSADIESARGVALTGQLARSQARTNAHEMSYAGARVTRTLRARVVTLPAGSTWHSTLLAGMGPHQPGWHHALGGRAVPSLEGP